MPSTNQYLFKPAVAYSTITQRDATNVADGQNRKTA